MLDPTCEAAYGKAITYIGVKTSHWSTEQFQCLFREEAFRALEQQIMDACERGDLAAPKRACKAWWTFCIAYQPTEVPA